MSIIRNVSENTLIIQQSNETWFINKTDEGIKLKCEFLTADGYEPGTEVVFNNEETESIIKFFTNSKVK